MKPEQFIEILALTESENNPNVHLGDNGRALGRFQIHPDWMWWASHVLGVVPHVGETWDSYLTRLVTRFFESHINYITPIDIAMYFHLGHKSNQTDSDWDKGYEERFNRHSISVLTT